MITEDQIQPGVEIVQESNGYTISARNGKTETIYRIVEQIDKYEWRVLIMEKDGNIYPEGLRSRLCLAHIKKCSLLTTT